jgi:glycosyltransferase involved in cell wall biosynthesis
MNPAQPSVLIVTSEMIGPFKNGGIGTATTGLIETVAGMGCPTTVLYTGAIWHLEINMARWVNSYAAIGVELISLSLKDMLQVAGPLSDHGFGAAYLVYKFLRRRRFDIVHFNDTLGEGMYALVAKYLGIGFGDTRMHLGLHSPTRWIYRLNGQPMDCVHHAVFDAMERVSILASDAPWGPSAYLVRDLRDDGLTIPVEPVIRQYVLPTSRLFDPDPLKFHAADLPPPSRGMQPIEEIVFFGRLENRKGLTAFCDALDLIADRIASAGVRITFLGKPVEQSGGATDAWIRARGQSWVFPWGLETEFGQPEAVAYLLGRKAVAIMPSPFDNSPCTIYEAMQFGFPFFASENGGIPELIHPEDRARVLFPYSAQGIARSLGRALDEGVMTARPRCSASERRCDWQKLHRHAPPVVRQETADPAHFFVIVDGDPAKAAITWASAARVLGDRMRGRFTLCGADPDGLAQVLEGARVKWVLCVTAGTQLIAEGVGAIDRALASPHGAAGLIPAGQIGERIVPSLGSAPGFGYFQGYLYTGGAIVAAPAILAALQRGTALPNAPFLGLVDAVAASGPDIFPCPEPLFLLSPGSAAPRPVLDAARARLFATVPRVEAAMIRDILAASAGRHPAASRVRALLLRAAGLPFYPLMRPLLPPLLGLAMTLRAQLNRLKSMLQRG